MKNLNKLVFFLMTGMVFSCVNSAKTKLPEILTAQYEMKTYSEFERGYEIFMVINGFSDSVSIKGIVLKNKLFDKIQFTEMQENEVFIEQFLPIQSQRIQKFKMPPTDNRRDGIIFEIEGKEIYEEINFKLK